MGAAMRRSEFDKLNVALDSTEFALKFLQKRAVELRRKRDTAKTQIRTRLIFCNSYENSARQFIPAIPLHTSGWFPKQNKDRSWQDTNHPR
jgi:hypothetical protein